MTTCEATSEGSIPFSNAAAIAEFLLRASSGAFAALVLAAAEECNALNETYLMVGDSLHDILAGSAAGAVTVAIGKDDGAAALADFRIDNLSELIPLADQLG